MNEKYFSRDASWSRVDDRLVVFDSESPAAPRVVTMEQWHEVAFMAADGEHTVESFIDKMAAQYENGAPEGLREQIEGIIGSLVDEHVLRLHDQPHPLPPYYAEEFFAADADTRRQQMQADGLIDE